LVRRRALRGSGKPSSLERQGLCIVAVSASRLLSNGEPSGRHTSGSWGRVLIFGGAPPPMAYIADDCLSALIYRDVLHPDRLIGSVSVSLERFDLRCERPG